MNGKVTSNVGQRVALWPVFPHEKHFTSDQVRRTCRSLGPCRGDCCSAKYVRSKVSSPGGSVLSLLLPRTKVGLNCPLVICPGPSPGERHLESVLPTMSLAVHHSDQPGCSVYLLSPHTPVQFHNLAAPPHKSDKPVLATVY